MPNSKRGFSLVELLVILFVISMLLALVLPGVMQARESARAAQCRSNLKQIGAAMHMYHDTNKTLPVGAYGCCWGTWMVALLPYVDEAPSFNAYDQNRKFGGTCFNPDTLRYNSPTNLTVTSLRFSVYTCPSDSANTPAGGVTSHNYAVNFGNTILAQTDYAGVKFREAPFTRMMANPGCKGATGRTFDYSTFRDGTGTTMLAAEVRQGQLTDLRGFGWWGEGMAFQTFLTPNSRLPDSLGSVSYCKSTTMFPCQLQTKAYPLMSAARSLHPGGVHVVMGDGAVKKVSNDIDINLWRAASTTQGGELNGL